MYIENFKKSTRKSGRMPQGKPWIPPIVVYFTCLTLLRYVGKISENFLCPLDQILDLLLMSCVTANHCKVSQTLRDRQRQSQKPTHMNLVHLVFFIRLIFEIFWSFWSLCQKICCHHTVLKTGTIVQIPRVLVGLKRLCPLSFIL